MPFSCPQNSTTKGLEDCTYVNTKTRLLYIKKKDDKENKAKLVKQTLP